MAVDAGRRFRFRRPVGLRPVMLRAGLAVAIVALVLASMTAKARDVGIDREGPSIGSIGIR